MDLKRLPAVIGVGLGVHACLFVLRIVTYGAAMDWMATESWQLAMSGVAVAGSFCLAFGNLELAARLTDGRARWLRLAAWLQLSTAALDMLTGWYEHAINLGWGWEVLQWTFSVLLFGSATCLALAARQTRARWFAVIFWVLMFVMRPPPPVAETLDALVSAPVYLVVRGAYLGTLATTLVLLARTASVAPADRSPQALYLLHGSIRVRVAAIGVLIAATMFAVSSHTVSALRFLIVAPVLVNIFAAIAFAAGAALFARGARRGVEVAFAVTAWLSAWMAGVLANQVPFMYGVTTENHRRERRYEETAGALEVPVKVAVIAAIAIALVALMVHIQQHGSAPLARFIRLRATAFVVLMTLAMTIAEQIFKARSTSAILMAASLTSGFGIAALLLAAGAFKRAATSTGATELPTARLVD